MPPEISNSPIPRQPIYADRTVPVKLPGLDQERSFVGVHNLHQSDRFHADFKRIPPTQGDLDKLKTHLGSTAENDWFRYEGTDKDGVQQVKLNVKLKQIKNDAPVSRSRAESDFKAYQEGYNALHKQLKGALDSAVSNAKKETTFFQRLFGNAEINNLRAEEEIKLSGKSVFSDREIQVLTKNSPDNGNAIKLDNVGDGKVYTDQHKLKKAAYLGLAGIGIGVLIAVAFLTGGLLGVVLGGMAVAGSLGMVLKAFRGKSPWWDKTAQGQREHMERKQARLVADEIREQVKEMSLPSKIDGKQKRQVFNDKAMLTDFVKLAAQNNADGLLSKVKEAVRDPKNEILSKETLDRLNFKKNMSMLVNLRLRDPGADAKSWKFDWGNRVAHAEKTADIVAYEIARGIMAGVQEAVLQTEVGALSDKRTVEGEKIVAGIVGQDIDGANLVSDVEGVVLEPKGIVAFQNAVNFLTPSEEASDGQLLPSTDKIYETEDRLKELNHVYGTIMPLIDELKAKGSEIGEVNVQQYTERLQKLEGDLSVHMASIRGVDELITGSRDPGAVHLNQILTGKDDKLGYTDLFTEGFEKSKAEVQNTVKELKETIQELRSRIADEEDMASSLLVKGQARALVALVGEVEKCIEKVGERSSQVAASRDAFKSEFTLEQLQNEKTKLAHLQTSGSSVDYDPTKKIGAINTAIGKFNAELGNLLELCGNVETASKLLRSYESVETELRESADNGDLKSALNPQKLQMLDNYFRGQKEHLKAWQDAGYKIPSDVTPLTQERLGALKLELTARALGVPDLENQKELAPILGKLADASHSDAVSILKELPANNKIEVLQKLQKLMGAEPQKALDSYILLKESLNNTENAKSVNAVLHAGQKELINKFENFSTADESLRNLFGRQTLQTDISLGELLRSHLLDGGSSSQALIGAKNGGYSVRSFLHMLSAFASENQNEELSNAANLTKSIAGLLPAEETRSWIRNAESFDNLSTEDLSRLATLAEELVKDDQIVQSVEQRFKDEQARVQAQAIADIQALKITGVSKPDEVQIREKVVEASSLNNAEAKPALDALLGEIEGLLAQQSQLQRGGTLSQEDIQKNLENLATALNWNAHKDPKTNLEMLKERLSRNHEVAQHFTAVLGLSVSLQAAQGIGPVNHEFFADELLAGAKAIPDAIKHISTRELERLPESLKQSLDQREKVKKAIDKKNDEKIQNLLKNNKDGISDYVKTFQQEGRFVTEIKTLSDNSSQPDANFRQQLEGAYDTQDNANGNLASQRATNLSSANLANIKEQLGQTWKMQTKVLDSLIKNSQNQEATGYYAAQLAQLKNNIEVLEKITVTTMRDPGNKDFAILGKMLLDSDHVTKLNQQPGDKLQLAYMKGQFELSRNAIKYLNPKTLEATRPGLIGRFIHRLFNRGERINRILRDSQKAQDIADWILSIKKSEVLNESQKAQLEAVNQSLETMFATRDSLVKDSKKVELAYQFLAAQHLANAGDGAKLSKSDIGVIKSQWKALLADDTKDAFTDIEQKIDGLIGKEMKDLQENLSTEEAKEVASAVDRLIQEQNDFLEAAAAFKGKLDDLRFGRLNLAEGSPDAILRKAVKEVGLEFEDYEKIQELKKKGVDLQEIIDQFQLAKSEIKPLEQETTTAVFRATQAKLKLEGIIESQQGLTPEDKASLQSISKIMEESFLERVGPSAPERLESRQDFAEIRAFHTELDAFYIERPLDSHVIKNLETQMEKISAKFKENELLADLQKNTKHVPVHLLDALSQARYQLARIYRDTKQDGLTDNDKNLYSLKYAAHAYTAALGIQALTNTKNDKSIPASLRNELRFEFVQDATIIRRFPAILTSLELSNTHSFTVDEMQQRKNDAAAQNAHRNDEAVDLSEENTSSANDYDDADTQGLTKARYAEMLSQLEGEQVSQVQSQKSTHGFFSNLFGSASKINESKPKKVQNQPDKLMSKAPSNPQATQVQQVQKPAPIQQMAPVPTTAKGYLAKIKNDNTALHGLLQKALQQPAAQPAVQSSPQVKIPAFKEKGDKTVIDSNNMGELQQIDSLKDYLSPKGAKYQPTLQTMNSFRSIQESQLLTNPSEYFIGKTLADVKNEITAVFDAIQPVNEQPALNPRLAISSIGRKAVAIQDNGQCFYLSLASARGKTAVLGLGEDVSKNAQTTRRELLDAFVKLDDAGMKFVTGVNEVINLPVSLNKVFKTLTTGLDGKGVNPEGWGGPEEARLAAMAYNRPVVSIRSEGIVITYPNKTEERCAPDQLQEKLAGIQSQKPIVLILQNNHWQNTVPEN